MDINNVNSMYSNSVQDSSTTQSSSNSGQIDKDGFLKILVSELKNQDPMNSQDDTQYIAQMAQFSALEQMENLNEGLQNLSINIKFQEGSSMIGKSATIHTGNDQYITGLISGVKLTNGTVKVVCGGNEYDIDDVTGLDDGGGI